jgi:hypothetical protein
VTDCRQKLTVLWEKPAAFKKLSTKKAAAGQYTVLWCAGSSPMYSPLTCWLQSNVQSSGLLVPILYKSCHLLVRVLYTVLLCVVSSPIYSPLVVGSCPVCSHVIFCIQSYIQPSCVLSPVLYTILLLLAPVLLCLGYSPIYSPIVCWLQSYI